MNKKELLLVSWLDAESDSEWQDEKEITGEPPLIITVGFLIKKTKTAIVIAQSLDLANDNVCMVMTIPIEMCVSIKKLKS